MALCTARTELDLDIDGIYEVRDIQSEAQPRQVFYRLRVAGCKKKNNEMGREDAMRCDAAENNGIKWIMFLLDKLNQ